MNNQRNWRWLIIALCLVIALYLLAPVLTPFAISALFAYLGDPIVDRLERRFSRTAGVSIVFACMTLLAVGVLAVLIPEIIRQASGFPQQLEKLHQWVDAVLSPWLQREFGFESKLLDLGTVFETARAHLQDIGAVLPKLFIGVGKSGIAVIGVLANALLVPVLTFYLLRDWDVLTHRIRELLPRPIEPTISQLAFESDVVLGSFLRGQLSVMVMLGAFYAIGLTLAGVQFGLLIGFVAGLLSFVPYLGPAIGIVAGAISALVSPGDPWMNVALVAVVFGLGQVLESFFLTPWLVGDKIGLHPVAVIFSIMAGGQLFGFFGILLALPVAAIVMVVLRHTHQRYLASHLYRDIPAADDGNAANSAGNMNSAPTASNDRNA